MLAQSGLDLIQSFMVVAEELSFRRGAERMNIDQSALSRRIRKLEHLLEFPLFERTTRDVSLTPAGRALYEKNTLLLEQFSSSIEKARLISEGKTGRLRIAYTAVSSISPMPQAVHLFQQKSPHVNVKLRFLRAHDQKLALVNDEIDLGYMIGPFEHSEFRSLLLMSDPLCVVMPFGHPLAEKSEIRPADLDGVDLTLGSKIKSETYRWRLDDLFSREGVSLHISQEVSTSLAIFGLIAAGSGVSIYPESLVKFFSSSVEWRPIAHPDFVNLTLLIWRSSNRTTALQNFVDVAESIIPQ